MTDKNRICKKEGCNNYVVRDYIDDDGKKHNCQRRKFCLSCSPFGEHNTRDFNAISNRKKPDFKKYFNQRKRKVSAKAYGIVGYGCWYCNYNIGIKGTQVLEFHHLDPNNKKFSITTREMVGHKWCKILKEMKKCVSLCCRCHREVHIDLISAEEIKNIHQMKWKKILSRA